MPDIQAKLKPRVENTHQPITTSASIDYQHVILTNNIDAIRMAAPLVMVT